METLKTKSQMLNRIAELNELVAKNDQLLDIAIKENQKLNYNMNELKRLITRYITIKDKEMRKRLKHRLSVIANMRDEEWWEYMNRE